MWESEARELRKDWEKERKEKLSLIRQEKRLQSEMNQLRKLNDAGRTRENALENEVVELRNAVGQGKRELAMMKEWYEAKVSGLERVIKDWEREQQAKQYREKMEKERMERIRTDVRERIK